MKLGLFLTTLLTSTAAFAQPCQCPPQPTAGPVTVIRTVYNPSLKATANPAFWTIGHAFKDNTDVPPGYNITSAKLSDATVPASCVARIHYTSGYLRWCQVLVDFSSKSIPAGEGLDLVLQVTRTTPNGTTTRTNADWVALGDVLKLSEMTTTGLADPTTTGSGTWTCAFDGAPTNTVELYGSSPQGLFVEVTAECRDGEQTHRNLFAVMDYWVTQKPDGSPGPIESWGPYIFNTKMHPADPKLSTMAQFNYAATYVRSGEAKRTFPTVRQQAWSVFGMTRPDGQGDWTSGDPGIWVSPYGQGQTISALAETGQFPPIRPDITRETYKGQAGHRPNTQIESVDPAYDQLTVGSRVDISYGMQGAIRPILQRPVAVELTGILPGGLSTDAVYWANSQVQLASQSCVDGVVTSTTEADLPWPPGAGPNVKIVGAKPSSYAVTTSAGVPITITGNNTFTYNVSLCVGAVTSVGQLELLADKIMLYDNFANAINFGHAGKVDITSAGTGTIQNAVAPGSPGQWNQSVNPTGNQPFLAALPENTLNYYTGNTQAYQRNARVNTISFAGFPVMGTDAAASEVPPPLRLISLLDDERTPNGLVSYTDIIYGSGGGSPSRYINDGKAPGSIADGTTGGWGTDAAHATNGHYLVWLSEGTPILRDLTLLYANGISARTTASVRNTSVDGVTYYNSQSCTQQVGSIRAGAWGGRNKFLALPVAPEGPLQEYFKANVKSEADFCNDYHNYQGSAGVGVQAYWEDTKRPPDSGTINMGWFQPDQEAYLSSAIALGDLLTSDWVPEMREVTRFLATWSEKRWNNPTQVCPRLAMTYTQNVQLGSPGDPSPGSFITSYADLGYGTGGSVVVAVASGSPAVATLAGTTPWGVSLTNGDILRLVDYPTNDVKKIYPWFDDENDGWTKAAHYFVRNKSGNNFNLSKTPTGALMDNSGVLRGVGAWYVWQEKNGCPSGVAPGAGGLGATSPTAINTAAMAIMVRLGLVSQAAWDTGDQRNPTADYNAVSTWGWKP